MSITRSSTVTALVFAFLSGALAQAQQKPTSPPIPLGKWSGQITTPNGAVSPATYDVSMKEDKLAITIDVSAGSFPTWDIKVEGTKLSFSFSPAADVACVLERKDDGSYEGACKPEKEGARGGKVVMIPPKKGLGA